MEEEITTERRIAELEAKSATVQQELDAVAAWLESNIRHPDFYVQVRRMHSKQTDLRGLARRIKRITEGKPEHGRPFTQTTLKNDHGTQSIHQ